MYLEFEFALRDAARRLLGVSSADCDAADALRVKVVQAPPDVDAQMASNIAFEISSHMKSRGKSLLPMTAVQQLLECFKASEGSKYFSVHIGGDGYLNASPTQEFAQAFFAALSADPHVLLKDESFLCFARSDRPERWLMPLPALDTVRTRLNQRGRSDVLALLEEPSFGDLLVAFAACAEPELDLGAYVNGYYTSEAVPWYLDRAVYDAGRFLDLCRQEFGTENSPAVPKYGQTAYNNAAAFRGQIKVGDGRSNAVRLVGSLKRFAAGFYEFFNRPNCRVPSQLSGSDALAYCILSNALVETTAKGLELLRISCEDGGLVLEK